MMLNRMAYELAQERREREIAEAIERRRNRADEVAIHPVRRAVGRSIISIGARIAAEPQPRLARSR